MFRTPRGSGEEGAAPRGIFHSETMPSLDALVRSLPVRSGPSWPLLAAGLLLALLAAAAAPAPATAQEHSPYGINAHIPSPAQLDRAVEAGIGWIRIDFIWALAEPQPRVYHWAIYDELVAQARSRGLEILALIAYTPAWATDGPEISGVPRDVEDWRRFCSLAAARYRDSIRFWEIWNEPNLPRFWVGTREEYWERILIPGADAIRASNPRARIAGPGLAHLSSAGWYRWLPQTLERAGDRLDILTHHVYGGSGHGQVTRRLDGRTTFGSNPSLWGVVSPSVREVLEHAGATEMPFWLTETGFQSADFGEHGQADEYRGYLGDWHSGDPNRSWVEKVFFYELQDPPTDYTWGILRADGSRKPAFDAYRQHIAVHPPGAGQLLLHDGRFSVTASWRDHRTGRTGTGQPIGFSQESGLLWFFGAENLELSVKLLDGGLVNGHFWFYFGALSDVEYWLTVTDRATGAVRKYHNPPGTYCGQADTRAFPAGGQTTSAELAFGAAAVGTGLAIDLAAPASAGCAPGPSALCLREGRFRVETEWHDPRSGRRGVGTAIAAAGDSGYFWFFGAENLELVVKVLDGRGVNGRHWVFYSALSDVEYWVTVTDTVTGQRQRYHNPPYTFCGRADVEAF